MGQCKKILSQGERCSDRAVPGTDYCEHHGRIQFRKVTSVPVSIPEPAVQPRTQTPPVPAKPHATARPSAMGEKPTFPDLRADARHILVAPEGLIFLPQLTDQAISLDDRVAKLLSNLSQQMPLAGHLSVRLMDRNSGVLVSVSPSQTEQPDLSRFYDAASVAAGLSEGVLFIGKEQTFIRYRDAEAPRGYNADAIQSPSRDSIYLVDRKGTHTISQATLREADLSDLLLRIAPVSTHSSQATTVLFVLALPALCDILVRYFRVHYLSFKVAQILSDTGRPLSLLEVTSRPDSPSGAQVPPYVISYLSGLPHTLVCTAVESNTDRQLLVQWQHQYPCLIRNVREVFKPNSLIVLTAGPYFSNLLVSPIPTFFEGDQLTSIRMKYAEPAKFTPIDNWRSRPFELPVRLLRDSGPLLSTAALILKEEEVDWVRRLLHRVPAEAFANYQLCLGQDSAVLLATSTPLESLPFGMPFRRIEDTNLFIPPRMRFTPALPWPLLANVLKINDDMYTFFSEEFRLDVPRNSFVPLSRALVAGTDPPRSSFELQAVPTLPKLKWIPPPPPEAPVKTSQKTEEQRRSWKDSAWDWLGRRTERPRHPSPTENQVTTPSVSSPLDADRFFKEKAETFVHAGDELSAAFCFALAGDNYNAAQCYQAAARKLKSNNERNSFRIG